MMREFYRDFHPQVEDVEENADRESGERILGEDPATGRPVLVRLGKYGPMAQIGDPEDENKRFASLRPDQQLHLVTFEEVMDLFKLPKDLGIYEGKEVEANVGRYGPYIRWGKTFVSLPKGMDPLDATMDLAKELIEQKKEADAPIYMYEGLPVQKGKGRFGPFIKWDGMFINVNKKYNFDDLSEEDIIELIEDKKKKESEKLVRQWKEQDIRVEKARWGRFNLIKGKTKIELPKTTDVDALTLEGVEELLEAKTSKPKRKSTKKKTTSRKK
jgi:DNA topoisomerase-1